MGIIEGIKQFFMFIFERDTHTECEQGRVHREGDTESEAGSGLQAVNTEPTAGF